MSLPAFSELMASLQLTSKGEPEIGKEQEQDEAENVTTSPSPSSSTTSTRPLSTSGSPSIIVSQFESPRLTRPNDPRSQRSLGRSNRFAPYQGTKSNTQSRRSSTEGLSSAVYGCDEAERASSASPKTSSTTLQDLNINARPPQSHEAGDIDPQSDVPISSFARRRTPQSSPTAPTFPHRRRPSSQNAFSPLMLPSLPSGLNSSSPPHIGGDMDVSEVKDSIPIRPLNLPKPRTRQQGLRLSSYRDPPRHSEETIIAPLHSAS